MRRREFIILLGGGAAASPLAARAQQLIMPVVGFLGLLLPETSATMVTAFRKGLSEAGFLEGSNVAIEYRWASNEYGRLPDLAADLAHRPVSVIAATGSLAAALAAKEATATVPIVFNTGTDPVRTSLVPTINRPGGNITGVSTMNFELGTKWLGLLHESVPGAKHAALLVDGSPESKYLIADVQASGLASGLQIEVLRAGTIDQITTALADVGQKHAGTLLIIAPGPVFLDHRVEIATLALRYGMPSLYANRAFAEAGGLISYGSDFTDTFRQAGIYCGRILKGERPADLPVQLATRFEFVINLKTAKALYLQIPPTLLALTDEVIE
jgi:putative tryptophan/tyrosine transport system substrate-binding protein